MPDRAHATDRYGGIDPLADEVERLRTALDASAKEVARLAADRDRLLRGVAFDEMQVLTDQLEVANNSLHETNRALDRHVAEHTHDPAHANDALVDCELRFRALLEGLPQLVWRSAARGIWTWASPQWSDYTGLGFDDSMGLGWLDALHPDDRVDARTAWARVETGAALDFEARIFHRIERRHRHVRFRAAAKRGGGGAAPEWLGTATDMDDLFRLQERQQVLVAELQHRVHNMLAVIRTLFGRTVEAGGELEDVANHFRGRLDSLARTQLDVTRNPGGLVDLQNLIRNELMSVGAGDGERLLIDGPDVALPAETAETVGLAIHELTTNALKYGALKTPNATLRIQWEYNMGESGVRRLVLIWAEQGVPTVALKPARRGFGSELINETLPYRLGAETKLEFRGGGVRCELILPLPARHEIGAAVGRM